jgi:hypothetical protein
MNTVKVRIAVCVDSKGNWNASGWKSGKDSDKMGIASEGVDDGEARYWIEAELAIPEYTIISGIVISDSVRNDC